MWMLIVITCLFAWRFQTAFAVFVFAPVVGTCFAGFVWGVVGLLSGTMASVATLGWLVVAFTTLIAAIAAAEQK